MEIFFISYYIECPIARDCKSWFEAGVTKSGIYPIKPDGNTAFQVNSIRYISLQFVTISFSLTQYIGLL